MDDLPLAFTLPPISVLLKLTCLFLFLESTAVCFDATTNFVCHPLLLYEKNHCFQSWIYFRTTHHLSVNTSRTDSSLNSHHLHLRFLCSAHVPHISSCRILFSLTFCLCAFEFFWFIAHCWLFQQKPMIEIIKLDFFLVFFLVFFSF